MQGQGDRGAVSTLAVSAGLLAEIESSCGRLLAEGAQVQGTNGGLRSQRSA